MAFHDIRLPEDIERGAVGGPRFKTTVLMLQSGYEQRNIDWQHTRGEWDIGYGLMSMDEEVLETSIHKVRDFYYNRQGRAHGFRFKDWSDFQIGDYTDAANDYQEIGLGTGAQTVFQVNKRYMDEGNFVYQRTIRKLVSGAFAVLLDGVVQNSGVTVDVNTGTVTFSSPPAATGGIGAGGRRQVGFAGEFDVPVRFDSDHLQINVNMFQAGSIPGLTVVELRL